MHEGRKAYDLYVASHQLQDKFLAWDDLPQPIKKLWANAVAEVLEIAEGQEQG